MALIPPLIGYYYHDNLNGKTWHVRFIKTKEGDVTRPAPPAGAISGQLAEAVLMKLRP